MANSENLAAAPSSHSDSVAIVRLARLTSVAYANNIGPLIVDEIRHLVPACIGVAISGPGFSISNLTSLDLTLALSSEYPSAVTHSDLDSTAAFRPPEFQIATVRPLADCKMRAANRIKRTYTARIRTEPSLEFKLLVAEDQPPPETMGSVLRYIQLLAEVFHQNLPSDTDSASTVAKRFRNSKYLSQFLLLTYDRVSSILNSISGKSRVRESPFFVQFFIPAADSTSTKQLRCYLLDSQKTALSRPTISSRLSKLGLTVEAAIETMESTVLDPSFSLEAYVGETTCTQFLRDDEWLAQNQEVPRDATEYSKAETYLQFNSILATSIDPRCSVLIVPLLCDGECFAVMRVNTQAIDSDQCLETIRSIRPIGVLVRDLIDLDERVHSLTNQASQQAQSHTLKSLFHFENAFCRIIENLMRSSDRLASSVIPSVDHDAIELKESLKVASLFVADRKMHLKELDCVTDPLEDVPRRLIFRKLRNRPPTRISVGELESNIETVVDVFDDHGRVRWSCRFGHGLTCLDGLPDFDDRVLRRILINLVKNTVDSERRNQPASPSAEVFIDVGLGVSGFPIVLIRCSDTCGGPDDPELFPSELSIEWWRDFVSCSSQSDTGFGFLRGYGLLQFLKYAGKDGKVSVQALAEKFVVELSIPISSWPAGLTPEKVESWRKLIEENRTLKEA